MPTCPLAEKERRIKLGASRQAAIERKAETERLLREEEEKKKAEEEAMLEAERVAMVEAEERKQAEIQRAMETRESLLGKNVGTVAVGLKKYEAVTITEVTDLEINIRPSGGVESLKFDDMTVEDRARFGFNPHGIDAARSAYQKQQAASAGFLAVAEKARALEKERMNAIRDGRYEEWKRE